MRTSYWTRTFEKKSFPSLDRSIDVDVVVVGGGLTGLSSAYLIKQTGKRVVVLERDTILSGDSAHTTAHLTFVTDTRLQQLIRDFGNDHAPAVWDAGLSAIDKINEIVQREKISCDFKWVPGYLHTTSAGNTDQTNELLQEAAEAAKFGFDAKFEERVPLFNLPGIRFPNQAKFHALQYASALANLIDADGSAVYEHSEATEFDEDNRTIKVGHHAVKFDQVIIATNVPVTGTSNLIRSALLQTKIAPYTSFAVGAHLPKGMHVPEALFWNNADPYRYLRIDQLDDGSFYVIYGGEDVKTGQDDLDDRDSPFRILSRDLKSILPGAEVDATWSGQVIETHDGLPYIGKTSERQFIATGYGGNGITFGTVAGMMASDFISGRESPWDKLFSPSRTNVIAGAWDYIKENIDYPYYLAKDRLLAEEGQKTSEVAPGQGKILRINGERLAVYREKSGDIVALSPSCTHLGCIVHWNGLESTWDCPCHGSRFEPTGEVVAGPAETPLRRVELPKST